MFFSPPTINIPENWVLQLFCLSSSLSCDHSHSPRLRTHTHAKPHTDPPPHKYIAITEPTHKHKHLLIHAQVQPHANPRANTNTYLHEPIHKYTDRTSTHSNTSPHTNTRTLLNSLKYFFIFTRIYYHKEVGMAQWFISSNQSNCLGFERHHLRYIQRNHDCGLSTGQGPQLQ